MAAPRPIAKNLESTQTFIEYNGNSHIRRVTNEVFALKPREILNEVRNGAGNPDGQSSLLGVGDERGLKYLGPTLFTQIQ